MKLIQSLLAVVQFLSLCQIAFLVMFFRLLTDSSDIPNHIQEEWVRTGVEAWHTRTVNTAVDWGIGFGVATFVLSTCAALVTNSVRRRTTVTMRSSALPSASPADNR